MKILVADDSDTARRPLVVLVRQLGLEVIEVSDGEAALAALLQPDGPRLALLDWEMPGLDGPEICTKVRAARQPVRAHLILVTGRKSREDTVAGLKAGADDYIHKPPHPAELLARLQVGVRNLDLQNDLQKRIAQLETAVQQLDAIRAVLAQSPPPAPGRAIEATGTIDPQALAVLPLERLGQPWSRFLSTAGLEGPPVARTGFWAHAGLGLPGQGTWLDLVLQCDEAVARRLGRNRSDFQDVVAESLGQLMKDVTGGLDVANVANVTPYPPKGWVGVPSGVGPGSGVTLLGPGISLSVWQTPSPLMDTTFAKLQPGQVLVEPLCRPSMPGVAVLAKGCLLKPGYLKRAGSFFLGPDAEIPLQVLKASHFSATSRD